MLTPLVCGQAARAAGGNPYPHKFHTTVLLPAYVATYAALQPGEQHAGETVAIAGEGLADVCAMTLLVAGAQEALKQQRNHGAALPVLMRRCKCFVPPKEFTH